LAANSASVTLGSGAVVRDNQTGVKLTGGICTLDGGEIRDNSLSGVIVDDNGVFTMRGGSVKNNRSGGVVVKKGGRFSMISGSITGNYDLQAGAGVYVHSGGRFDQTSGEIEGNIAPQSPDVFREGGAFGNDLSMLPESRSQRPVPSSSDEGAEDTSGGGIKFHIPLFLGLYGQGWREDIVSLGVLVHLGVEVDFGKAFTITLLGDAEGGFGYPYTLEGNLLGAAEVYFAGKRIGIGGGYGIHTGTMHFGDIYNNKGLDLTAGQEVVQSNFYRFSLISRLPAKISLFANYYDRGNWGDIENWGFGIQFSKDHF
jgi:hypothetical protein